MSTEPGEFGKRLQGLQDLRGISTADLAEHVGRSDETIRNWKKERHLPSRAEVVKLEEILDAPGELMLLAGYASEEVLRRLAAVEDGLAEIKMLFQRLLDQPLAR